MITRRAFLTGVSAGTVAAALPVALVARALPEPVFWGGFTVWSDGPLFSGEMGKYDGVIIEPRYDDARMAQESYDDDLRYELVAALSPFKHMRALTDA